VLVSIFLLARKIVKSKEKLEMDLITG